VNHICIEHFSLTDAWKRAEHLLERGAELFHFESI